MNIIRKQHPQNDNLMASFRNIRELINALQKGARLLRDMFDKRKTVSINYDTALEILDEKEDHLQLLLRTGVIEQVGDKLELGEAYLRFFEEVLEVNDTINVAMVQEYIGTLKLNIDSVLAEDNPARKAQFMRDIRHGFLNIERATKRNIVDLKRNAENTYKQEPNFKIKKLHLERLDEKRKQIALLINETERLIDNETTFLSTVADVAIRQAVAEVKTGLHESAHSLLDIEVQIIDYLNKIEYQSRLVKKVRLLKYLKDQVMLESTSNVAEVMARQNAVWFEPQARYSTKVSLNFLRNADDALDILDGARRQLGKKATIRQRLSAPMLPEDLEMQQEERRAFDHHVIINAFEAQGKDLFSFVWQYNFNEEVDREQRLVLFLQLASQFTDRLQIEDRTGETENISYPLITAKPSARSI